MGYYSGTDGELLLYVENSYPAQYERLGRVRNWSFSTSVATLDTTTLGDTDRMVIPGIRSTTGAATLFYYQDSPGKGADLSKLLQRVLKARTKHEEPGVAAKPETARLKLRINDGSVGGRYIEARCVITSVSMTMAVGEVLSADIAFEFRGAPNEVVL